MVVKSILLVLSLISALSLSVFPQSSGTDSDKVCVIDHSWTYKDATWTWTFEVEKRMYEYYRYERIHLSDDYNRYVFSEYDRWCIRNLVAAFRQAGEKAGYTDYDNVCNAVCFVQSLDYVFDADSRGEEDYVRYPVETLVDGEGDCEDASVLLAAILDEMGYGVVLLRYPEHLALGVSGVGGSDGVFFPYGGSHYYYLETTAKNWRIGTVPKEYENGKAEVIPLVKKPVLHIDGSGYRGDSYYLTDAEVGFDLNCKYGNTGPGRAEALRLHVIARPKGRPEEVIVERYFELGSLDEGESDEAKERIWLPRPLKAMLEFRIEGANVETKSMTIEGISLQ